MAFSHLEGPSGPLDPTTPPPGNSIYCSFLYSHPYHPYQLCSNPVATWMQPSGNVKNVTEKGRGGDQLGFGVLIVRGR